jgi:3-hydroxybutyryl-CoA dehydrogenase
MERPTIAVIGGGLMGTGIAQVFAAAGHAVHVQEPIAATRDTVIDRLRAGLVQLGQDADAAARVSVHERLAAAVEGADIVFEAAPEKLALEHAAPRHAILASNTSVMPIGSIVAGLSTQERMIGTHWWNPPTLIPLVEVIQATTTSDATVAAMMALLRAVGKKPAHVRKDVAGFVANRLQHALWREAVAMVADGICDAATVDDCVKHSFGLRLSVLGPLETADLVGLDLTRDIHRTILPALNRDTRPSPILDELIAAGRLGFKSGSGFRDWSEAEQAALRTRLVDHLRDAAARSSRLAGEPS